jgi:hypothetical protein
MFIKRDMFMEIFKNICAKMEMLERLLRKQNIENVCQSLKIFAKFCVVSSADGKGI